MARPYTPPGCVEWLHGEKAPEPLRIALTSGDLAFDPGKSHRVGNGNDSWEMVECAAGDRITADLAIAEAIALPLTAFLLIWVFGSAIAALLPPTILRDADGLRGVPASRIRDEWMRSGRGTADNSRAVALGVARTGRIITAAAALMSVVHFSMVASQVSFIQLFGLGLTITVLADATLVRGILVPALLQLMGRFNWWAPRWMVAPHARKSLWHRRIRHQSEW